MHLLRLEPTIYCLSNVLYALTNLTMAIFSKPTNKDSVTQKRVAFSNCP